MKIIFTPEQLHSIVAYLEQLPHMQVHGLITMCLQNLETAKHLEATRDAAGGSVAARDGLED